MRTDKTLKTISSIGFLVLGVVLAHHSAMAQSVDQTLVSGEYGATGGQGIGFNNTGVAFQNDVSAIQINPALLIDKPQYIVSGNYHWPASGNEFFQAGVVDSKTSNLAAGASYLGYLNDENALIKRRIHLGLAQRMGKIQAGISGLFLETNPSNTKKLRSVALGSGVVIPIAQSLRFGASVENLANRKIEAYAPRTYRAGLSYSLGRKLLANLDYQNKATDWTNSGDDKEQMVYGSVIGYWRQYLKLFASYGREIGGSGEKHEALSGGAGIENKNLALSYMVAMPHLAKKNQKHHAINLSLNLKL